MVAIIQRLHTSTPFTPTFDYRYYGNLHIPSTNHPSNHALDSSIRLFVGFPFDHTSEYTRGGFVDVLAYGIFFDVDSLKETNCETID